MQTFTQRDNQRVISSKGLASMGYGLSTAIGAALNQPNNSVFLVEGDGGFAQNLQELGTISANRLNVKIFIFSNNGYASIRMTQRNYFDGAWIGCDSETGLGLPDWQLIANSYGISYLKLNAQGLSEPGIKDVLSMSGPLVIEVPIDPEQTFYPKITSSIQSDGSMKSNPLHLMSPELPESISSRVLKYLNV
jgi:acetolactate synthase-1/2/3 large subunit